MAFIHIEPVPRRCSPGAILAFVCDHSRLDGKHIGKIAFVGRGATVEVPDAKAAGVVNALDGTAFQERPVRVRFAGKADFTDADPFANLSQLLDLEAAAEQAEARRRAALDYDAGDGSTLTALVLREAEFGLGGRLLLGFTRKTRTDLLPSNKLGPGSPVVFTQIGVQRGLTFRGVVHDRTWTSIGIAIEPPDDKLPDESKWRLDLTPDEVSRLRQQETLRRAASADGDRLAELRAVLLREWEPAFSEGRNHENDGPSLNPPQRDAIALALAAQDVAIIHGPPGTGKTTAVVELIGQAVARGDKVLACAPSNLAVDHLLDKLLAAGLRPVRLGHPARIVPALRDRALDLLVEKHAYAMFRKADKWTRAKPQPGERAALRREARALLGEARQYEALAAERILDEAAIVCATLTGLDSEVLGRRRFDLAVLDEACQSTKPASWLPLLRADRIVLAGDHCQLPPTVVSPEAAARGLAVSLMERLVALHGARITRRLSVQYRMHAAIMAFSNAEFNDGELRAADAVAGHRLCDLHGVRAEPLTEAPVQFIDTAGASYDEELEEETGSRFIRAEAQLAVRIVRALLAVGVGAEQIGVIAPYRAQVRLLRDRLTDVAGLEIDSVDGFQGREKEAVIITLVRSNPEGEIGFLADTRRKNVAFTRARRKLHVIGDSATLANHPFYQRMLTHFEESGAYSSVWEEFE